MLRPLRFVRDGLRAKPRLALAVSLGVFAASAAWTFTRPKIYEATAMAVWQRKTPYPVPEGTLACGPTYKPDVGTYVKVGESKFIAKRVALHLSASETDKLDLVPSAGAQANQDELASALVDHRRVSADDLSNLSFSIRHQRPEMAARLANLFAGEFCLSYETARQDERRAALEGLNTRVRQQGLRIERLRATKASEPLPNQNIRHLVPETSTDPEGATNFEHELQTNEEILQQLKTRIEEIEYYARSPEYTAAFAVPPSSGDFVSPNILRNLGIGLLAGLLLGTGAAAFSARIKSTSVLTPQE